MIFALYTMKALGGGQLVVSDYHKKGWDFGIAATMRDFLTTQPYVDGVYFVSHPSLGAIDYDLQHAEDDKNPEAFPEWHGGSWPGNCNIRKRYAVHFGVEYDPEAVWLTAPRTKEVDVAVHIPQRRSVRSTKDWDEILGGLFHLRVALLGEEGSGTASLLDSADHINSAKVFLGVLEVVVYAINCVSAHYDWVGHKLYVLDVVLSKQESLHGLSNRQAPSHPMIVAHHKLPSTKGLHGVEGEYHIAKLAAVVEYLSHQEPP